MNDYLPSSETINGFLTLIDSNKAVHSDICRMNKFTKNYLVYLKALGDREGVNDAIEFMKEFKQYYWNYLSCNWNEPWFRKVPEINITKKDILEMEIRILKELLPEFMKTLEVVEKKAEFNEDWYPIEMELKELIFSLENYN